MEAARYRLRCIKRVRYPPPQQSGVIAEVAYDSHKVVVAGSSPAPATNQINKITTMAEEQKQEQAASQVPKKYVPELCADTISKLPEQLWKIKDVREAFAKPFNAFRKTFKDPAEADRVLAKEIDFAAQAMLSNSFLVTCAQGHPEDLVNALKNVALTHSTLNPVLKQGYLVPFKGRITFMPSYMGLVDMLLNNGLVRKIEAHPVFEGEEFEVTFGTNAHLHHVPNPWGIRDKDHLKGCYYYVELSDGTPMYDTMSLEEIEAIRKRSPSSGQGKQSPWDTDYIEMAKKSLIRRAFKAVPKGSISEDKLKVVEVAFDYDEKVEREWIKSLDEKPRKSRFDEEEAITEVEYAEVTTENNEQPKQE